MAGWTVPGYTRIRVLGAGEAAGAVAGDGGDAGLTVEAVHDASGARVVITYPARSCVRTRRSATTYGRTPSG